MTIGNTFPLGNLMKSHLKKKLTFLAYLKDYILTNYTCGGWSIVAIKSSEKIGA